MEFGISRLNNLKPIWYTLKTKAWLPSLANGPGRRERRSQASTKGCGGGHTTHKFGMGHARTQRMKLEAQAEGLSVSNASRILKEASVWKRPVPFSEPGASLFLTICSVISP